MRNEFIKTENVLKFEDVCADLESRESLIGPSLAMVTGPAGRGKSEAAKRYATQSDAVYIPPVAVRTPLMLLQDICFEFSAIKPGRTSACLTLIEEEQRRKRRLIIIDEADLVEMRSLELLRNLNELTGGPILLIGEDDLKRKLGNRPRLSSRIRRKLTFAPISAADVALFYKRSLNQDLSAEVVQRLHKAAGGDWRPVLTIALTIERMMQASGLNDVALELAEQAVAEVQAS